MLKEKPAADTTSAVFYPASCLPKTVRAEEVIFATLGSAAYGLLTKEYGCYNFMESMFPNMDLIWI